MRNLGEIYRSHGRYAAAEPLLTRALEVRRRVLGDEHPDTLTSMSNLALLYENWGKPEKAAEWRRKLQTKGRGRLP